MSRTSYADRLARLRQRLTGEAGITVCPAPWVMAMRLKREPTAAELRLSLEEFSTRYPPSRPWEQTR